MAAKLWQAMGHGKQGRTQARSEKAEEAEAETAGLHPDARTDFERDAQELVQRPLSTAASICNAKDRFRIPLKSVRVRAPHEKIHAGSR